MRTSTTVDENPAEQGVFLDLGKRNYIRKSDILALLDPAIPTVVKLKVKAAKELPFGYLDLTNGNKQQTLIQLKGNRFILSNLPRVQLLNRVEAKIKIVDGKALRSNYRPRKAEPVSETVEDDS